MLEVLIVAAFLVLYSIALLAGLSAGKNLYDSVPPDVEDDPTTCDEAERLIEVQEGVISRIVAARSRAQQNLNLVGAGLMAIGALVAALLVIGFAMIASGNPAGVSVLTIAFALLSLVIMLEGMRRSVLSGLRGLERRLTEANQRLRELEAMRERLCGPDVVRVDPTAEPPITPGGLGTAVGDG